MLVKGTVLAVEKRTVKPKPNQDFKQFDVFYIHMMSGEGRPIVIRSHKNSQEPGKEIIIDCYVRPFTRKQGGAGYEIREVRNAA
jgi:hypothetical protein